MINPFSRQAIAFVALACIFTLPLDVSAAPEFFRIGAPSTNIWITSFTTNGMARVQGLFVGDTGTVYSSADLVAWKRYSQFAVTNTSQTLRLSDPSVPAGMSFIPGGLFAMGAVVYEDATNSWDEVPVHQVELKPFYMEQTTVSGERWTNVWAWATNHSYAFDAAHTGWVKAVNHPINAFCWQCAVKWCNARSEMEGLTPCYYTNHAQTLVYRSGLIALSNEWVNWDANGYRLPTEAEWEIAARGGQSGLRFPWGNTISHSNANYWSTNTIAFDVSLTRGYHPAYSNEPLPNTSPVTAFPANDYGLHDMAGNVWNLCWDEYDPYFYSNSPAYDPKYCSTGMYKVVRGGAHTSTSLLCRVSNRSQIFQTSGGSSIGLRCVRSRE